MTTAHFFIFWFSSLSTTDFGFLSFEDRDKGKKMAANSKVSKNSWRTQYSAVLVVVFLLRRRCLRNLPRKSLLFVGSVFGAREGGICLAASLSIARRRGEKTFSFLPAATVFLMEEFSSSSSSSGGWEREEEVPPRRNL